MYCCTLPWPVAPGKVGWMRQCHTNLGVTSVDGWAWPAWGLHVHAVLSWSMLEDKGRLEGLKVLGAAQVVSVCQSDCLGGTLINMCTESVPALLLVPLVDLCWCQLHRSGALCSCFGCPACRCACGGVCFAVQPPSCQHTLGLSCCLACAEVVQGHRWGVWHLSPGHNSLPVAFVDTHRRAAWHDCSRILTVWCWPRTM